ncbi:hypothetical protein Sango_0267400 [Sesamum angolense]|uniref:Paladin n=1 Tax=Sesamum angolense TaxID=2727404 RepID=A0AAE2C2Q0_9LAMI|nr:hypothetical protein Sango_0267400 [Sesamum angolense]
MVSMSIPKEPEQVIKQRDGSVLGKKTILKSDHFPGCHNKRLVPHIDGAPNYRKVHKISQANVRTEIVFNCQMGRGRTTTGMVIATLIYINRIGASGIPRTNSMGKVSDCCSTITPDLPNTEESIRRGEYAVIRSLIRVLEGGVEGKRQVDKVIDKCASMQEELRAPHESQHGDAVMEAIVKDRNGSVLGKGSILKMYFFPGQRTSSNIQIHGAPHVYKVDGYPVYSMATPTIAGAKEMELNKPVDTLKHIGITGPVVEHMEARLKEDIISEIRQSGGRMLLHREEYNPALKQASVVGYWENIFVDDIKTPAEVYAALKHEGYNIAYKRTPLTREREALASDVDSIQYCKEDSAGSYLFVSHTGFGGVAYAMAIICIKLEAEAALTSRVSRSIGSPCSSNSQEEFSNSDEEARKMGDYRDILSLIRVLVQGPESKADVDSVIDKCAGAGHLRDDILYYSKELEKLSNDSDEHRAYLVDMGIKALRRYFFLIAFRSYLYSTSANEMKFTAWMDARPELGHLCNNLRVDRNLT